MLTKSTSLMIIVLLATSAFALPQLHAHAVPAHGNKVRTADVECAVNFNKSLPNFCVTGNGNIEEFEFPATFFQIFTEGYGICDQTTGTSVSYFDVGDSNSQNWQDAVITAGGTDNKFPLTIKRTSSDGVWTITQTFSRSTADAYVKVQITLKNNTAADRFAYMTRYVDIDADFDPSDDYFDGTSDSGWGYLSVSAGFPNHGLMIRSSESGHNYFGFNVPSGDHDPCAFTANAQGTPTFGDEAVMYVWDPNGDFVIPAGKSIKVTLEYRAM